MAKIMISLPQEFLKKVDRAARTQGRSRSELIREALRTLLSESQGDRRSWKEGLAPLKELEQQRSEEHTSELQSHSDLVCRLLLEKKKNKKATIAGNVKQAVEIKYT